MSSPTSAGADLTTDASSLHALLQLARGRPRAEQGLDWSAVLARAERERLLGVAWQRSAEAIRRDAPAAISSAWQRRAILIGLGADQQLGALAETIETLRSHGVSAVVLKGFPLAQRIYRDHTVRPVLDADLYIPREQRSVASDALASTGWRWVSGCAPEEERFERLVGQRTFVLEVHSSALDDRLLDHIQFPVEQERVRVGGHDLPAHSGRFVPAFLATHLAKHHEKPLLWAVDFFTFWETLSESDRREAIAAANEAGLGRHLESAIRLCEQIAECDQDLVKCGGSIKRLERSLTSSGDASRLVRLVSLSKSPTDALRVIAGRVWPVAYRQGWRHAPAYFLRRGVSWLYRHRVFEGPSVAPGETEDAIALSADDCEHRLVATLARGASAWVSPADGSMEPAIPRFAAVRAIPLNGHGVRPKDVVVVRDVGGRCALRRVTSLGPDTLQLRPDTLEKAEQAVPYSSLVAICDVVAIGRTYAPIGRRPHGTLTMLGAIVRGSRRVSDAPRRAMYAFDFDSSPASVPETPVRFVELSPDQIRERAATLSAGGQVAAVPNGADVGCIVGMLSGHQVYHVWYARAESSRLHDLPDGWRPHGRVLFLHGGYTEPEFRRRGIHSAALRWLLAREHGSGTTVAVAVVNADNLPAVRAVESVGFRVIGPVT